MLSLLCFVMLPALLAAEFTCPDGTSCPDGKACCYGREQKFKCCDINTKGSRKLIPGVAITSAFNQSAASSDRQQGSIFCELSCAGTCCDEYCCRGHYAATCCSDPSQCCPAGHECCNNEYCCAPGYTCSSFLDMCVAGAPSLTSSLATLALLLIISKIFVH